MLFHLTRVSSNVKTGPMPVTTSSADTCPDVCPLKGTIGCYANAGQMRYHWKSVSRGDRGLTWKEFLAEIATLPRKQIWRHNQAGDLPGDGNKINAKMLRELVDVNRKASLHGFTYTHKPILEDLKAKVPVTKATAMANRKAIRHANDNGFVINLSANTLAHADEMADKNVGPVVVIVPQDTPETTETPAGRRVIVCPAQTRERVVCSNCRMCCDAERTAIIGFRAHGSGYKTVERIIKDINAKKNADSV